MQEGRCPLIQAECMKEGCLWYATGIAKCAVVAIGVLLNNIHDLEVSGYQRGSEPPEEAKQGSKWW